jgi:hypothetical protein
LTSLTLTKNDALLPQMIAKKFSYGANGSGDHNVYGDRVTVMVGKYKGQIGTIGEFTPSGKSAYVLLDGERRSA